MNDKPETEASMQAVLYLSLLSAEISLKALLEKAGRPIPEIRKRNHNLAELLNDLASCEYQFHDGQGHHAWFPASFIGNISIDESYGNATIEVLLNGEKEGASKYPTEIRYGDQRQHYPYDVICKMAFKIIEWAKTHWATIRIA